MSKKMMIGVGVGFLLAAGIAAAAKKGPSAPSPDMWAKKMHEKMEAMPDDFPPKMMFHNVEATRANTEEILALLRREGSERTEAAAGAQS